MKCLVSLHFLLGLIALIVGVVIWRGFIHDEYYAALWSTFIIFSTATTGSRQLKYGGQMKIYAIMSGVSIVTSIAGAAIFIHTNQQFNTLKMYCEHVDPEMWPCNEVDTSATLNIVVMIAVILSIPIAGAVIYYVKKSQSSPNISTFNTEQGVVVNNQAQPANPQQQGYPHQQQGYPPQQQGYPPQQQGYPPQQPGYPPQQAGYPLQQPGYTPQQPGYPLQQPGYPPQQAPIYPPPPGYDEKDKKPE